MGATLNENLLNTWVTGWAACRGYETGWEGRFPTALLADRSGEREYFALNPEPEEFARLAAAVKETSGLLTVLTDALEECWSAARSHSLHVQDSSQCLMMVDMDGQDVEGPITPEGFETAVAGDANVHHLLMAEEGREAARGSVAVVDGTAVFDRIITAPAFRRRGLGSYVMRALTAVALEQDAEHGLLIASAEGRQLYRYLGWDRLSEVLMLQGRPA